MRPNLILTLQDAAIARLVAAVLVSLH